MHNPHVIRIHAEKQGLGISRKTVELIRSAAIISLAMEDVDFDCEIDITLTDDDGIQEINREQRSIDASTDVLSFPAVNGKDGQIQPEPSDFNTRTGRLFLGDMVISIPHARAQGIEFGHGMTRETAYLTVHSVMHLLGYDHVDDEERKALMRQREERVLAMMGLSRDAE